jgi:hypothetical protein
MKKPPGTYPVLLRALEGSRFATNASAWFVDKKMREKVDGVKDQITRGFTALTIHKTIRSSKKAARI